MIKSPTEAGVWIKQHIKIEWKIAFWSAFLIGLLVHMPQLLSDIPNHDGLASMHFNQNMITSGRWFLTVACGFSSYYTIPWVIGILSMALLGLVSAVLTEFFEVHKKEIICIISALLVTFPAIASTFAYVFTMDGYMLALLLAVLAVLLTKKYKKGFFAGAVCLAFSMGIYQAYLPFAILLCIYGMFMSFMDSSNFVLDSSKMDFSKLQSSKLQKNSFLTAVHMGIRYFCMGVLGVIFYYIILQVLLLVQGKVLANYQGINGMTAIEKDSFLSIIIKIYRDFVGFTLRGNVIWNNFFSAAALLFLAGMSGITLFTLCYNKGWWKKIWFYLIAAVVLFGLPIATNIILIISPQVTYHLLMRYQWVVYIIIMVVFLDRYGGSFGKKGKRFQNGIAWGILISSIILIGNYSVTDNIAYSNLQKRYEKTYAYCIRLLDRIEQTPGYYQGIPIAMIGVVGDNEYPLTDITLPVTSNMIGMNGDVLLYTGANYQLFIKHYLGATLNILPAEVMEEIYYSKEYYEMESFPKADSIRIINGIMYVKTENQEE